MGHAKERTSDSRSSLGPRPIETGNRCTPRKSCSLREGLPAKYEPRRVIGTGGMGTVLLARDRSLGRLVAIKVLRTDCSDYLRRLREEARMLARLEHPSIVRVHDLDVQGSRLYLAMEYASGGNLALARLDPSTLVRSLRGVVDALGHAHANGIVHRDVKPENLLIRGNREAERGEALDVLLSDFGLACGSSKGSLTMRRPITGTPLAMSPEQTAGELLGPASDMFSLGVTLYRKLTGRWPFRGRTVVEVFDSIRHRTPAPLSSNDFPIPRRLERIVLGMLAKEPSGRIASMEELGKALDGFLRSRVLFSLPRRLFERRQEPGPRPILHPGDLS